MTEEIVVEKRVRRKPVIVIVNGQPGWDDRATLKDVTLVASWLKLELQFRIIDQEKSQ